MQCGGFCVTFVHKHLPLSSGPHHLTNTRHRDTCRVAEHDLSRGAAHVPRSVLLFQLSSAKVIVVEYTVVHRFSDQGFHRLDGGLSVAVRAW